jgi:hypothetical protein
MHVDWHEHGIAWGVSNNTSQWDGGWRHRHHFGRVWHRSNLHLAEGVNGIAAGVFSIDSAGLC